MIIKIIISHFSTNLSFCKHYTSRVFFICVLVELIDMTVIRARQIIWMFVPCSLVRRDLVKVIADCKIIDVLIKDNIKNKNFVNVVLNIYQ